MRHARVCPRVTPRTRESGMRIFALAAGLILGAAIIVVATEAGSKTDAGMCRVVCSPAPAAKPVHHARARAAGHRRAHRHASHHTPRHARHYARRDYYSYRDAEAIRSDEWHGRWHAAPNDAMIPAPPPPPAIILRPVIPRLAAIAAKACMSIKAAGPAASAMLAAAARAASWTAMARCISAMAAARERPDLQQLRPELPVQSQQGRPFQPAMGGFAPRTGHAQLEGLR